MEWIRVAVTGAHAQALAPFVMPQVWADPARDSFWFLAARQESGRIMGVVVVDPTAPQARLLSMGVAPAFTGMGVATDLLDYAITLLDQAGIPWLGLTYTLPPNQWPPLASLLEDAGFQLDGAEGYAYETTLDRVISHPLLAPRGQAPRLVKLGELSHLERGKLITLLTQNHTDPSILADCDPDTSFLYPTDQSFGGMVLLTPLRDGVLCNQWTWFSPEAARSRVPVQLFYAAFSQAAQTCPPDTRVVFTCVNQASDKLLHHFFPDLAPTRSVRSYITATQADLTEEEREEELPPMDPTPYREAYWNDMHLEPADDADLACARCRYRMKEDMTVCGQFLRKPGAVLYGGPCPAFSARK